MTDRKQSDLFARADLRVEQNNKQLFDTANDEFCMLRHGFQPWMQARLPGVAVAAMIGSAIKRYGRAAVVAAADATRRANPHDALTYFLRLTHDYSEHFSIDTPPRPTGYSGRPAPETPAERARRRIEIRRRLAGQN